MTKETWYRRLPNGRYSPIGEAEKNDYMVMPDGFVLAYRKDGMTCYEYEVKPDTAGFVAAATVSRAAMEDALRKAASYKSAEPVPYTKRQLALIEQFKRDMGMDYPRWWKETSARDIAQAGIDAVRGGE